MAEPKIDWSKVPKAKREAIEENFRREMEEAAIKLLVWPPGFKFRAKKRKG